MATLSKMEQRAFDALLNAENETLGSEEIADAIYGRHKPANVRQAVASTMRMLGFKTEAGMTHVIRVSGLGRGQRGVWQIKR